MWYGSLDLKLLTILTNSHLKAMRLGSISVLIIAFLCTACIKRYDPKLEGNDTLKFVVTGGVYKGDSVQHVYVSTTSPVSRPKLFPVTGCIVKVFDDKGHSYAASDRENGTYDLIIPESELLYGVSYRVDILLPDGSQLRSDFDQIHECPELNSLYYKLDSLTSFDMHYVIRGIRFYTDLDAVNTDSHYFRWEATESWEYQSVYPIEWWYNGTLHHEIPPDYSRSICWKTALIKTIFTLTTKNLAINKYNKLPFHFVDNVSSSRLVYGYSILLRQYAQSEEAFNYWEKLRVNSSEQGGLFEKQPLVITGNIHNITNPEIPVLGFFEAAEVKMKRIFVKNVENLPIEFDPGCTTAGLEPRRSGLKGIPSTFFPAYLYGTVYGFTLILLDNRCYDCLASEGDTIKPDFWPF